MRYTVTVAAEYHWLWEGEAASESEAKAKAITAGGEALTEEDAATAHNADPHWTYSGLDLETGEAEPVE